MPTEDGSLQTTGPESGVCARHSSSPGYSNILCLQHKDKAVNLAAKLKIAVDEVKSLRERFTKKDDAVKQLRRRRAESAEPKTLIKEGASSQVMHQASVTSVGNMQS